MSLDRARNRGRGLDVAEPPLAALSAASETVARGYYAPTLLSTVDPDLAVGNIKNAVDIFGKVGTLPAGGVETLEKYADDVLAAGASYLPLASGIFFCAASPARTLTPDYYSTVVGAWYSSSNIVRFAGFTAIGDGANFRIKNDSAGNSEYCLMRQFYSIATYERVVDEQLAINATWTPATSGFFAGGSEGAGGLSMGYQLNFTTAGWQGAYAELGSNNPITLAIGDGTNFRSKNGGTANYQVSMRASLT